tara:strand:+ start:172 stop:669 length:498 start_codon:yes stop_codon:yes gene_type:complete
MKRFEGDKTKIEELYATGKSIREIATGYGVNMETMRHYCHRVGIKVRARGEATRVGHQTGNIVHWWSPPNKKAGWKRADGYIREYYPNHPNSDKRGNIWQHRRVMTEKLGRPLKPNEIVHHLNGITSDNRQENLFLTDRENHDRFSLRRALQVRIRELEQLHLPI